MNKEVFVTSGIAIFLVAVTVIISAQPPTFHQFYGQTVLEDGNITNSTYYVRAFINNLLISEVQSFNGTYGYNDVLILDGYAGDIITFTLNNYFSTNVTFISEGITELNLTYNNTNELICTDVDGDGYSPLGGTCGAIDCNDNNAAIRPGRSEDCNTPYDDDCDGLVNEGCTSSSSSGSSGSSGSGSGGGNPYFEIDTGTLNINVAQGQSQSDSFTISNPTASRYNIYVSKTLPFVELSENNFEIMPDSSKTITVTASPNITVPIDLYIDIIRVWTLYQEVNISLGVNVVSTDSIFDIFVDIVADDENILPGEILNAAFLMKRLVPVTEGGEVLVHYYIKDNQDNIIYEFQEVQDIKDEASFVKEFLIPEGIKNGDYVLFSSIEYSDGDEASAFEWFSVGPKPLDSVRWILIIVLLSIGIIVVVIILIIHYKKGVNSAQMPTRPTLAAKPPPTTSQQ